MEIVQYLLLGSVFVLVTGLTFGGYRMMARRRQREMARLKSDTASDPSIGSTPELVLGDLTPALAEQVPMGEENRSELQRELRQAGYYKPTAVMEYAAVRTALVILPLVVAGVASLFAINLTQVFWIWLAAIVISALGFSLPRVYLYFKGKSRMQAIELGMPTAIDMLTLCLSAGLNVHSSLRRVSEELNLAYPTLAYELGIMRQQAELRSLEFALKQFAERVGLPQARNLSVILTQSENLGTDAVTVLREYADNMRINQRQRAEELANKAPFKLLFPAYLMAFGAAIFLIAPTVLEIDAFRKENMIGEGINDARTKIENMNSNPVPALAPRTPNRTR
jgi:tight adherence protein C